MRKQISRVQGCIANNAELGLEPRAIILYCKSSPRVYKNENFKNQ